MLLSFTVGNFRSIRDRKTLSMRATNIKEREDIILKKESYNVLPCAVIYGANSSGKSNVIKSIVFMEHLIRNSVKLNPSDELMYDPFILNDRYKKEPTLFEIEMLQEEENIIYTYGFEYNKNEILKEWLTEKKLRGREYDLFLRVRDEYYVSKTLFNEGNKALKISPPPKNRLFLSYVSQIIGGKATDIFNIVTSINSFSGIETESLNPINFNILLKEKEIHEQVSKIYSDLQLGFSDFQIIKKKIEDSDLPTELRKHFINSTIIEIKTSHNIYDDNGKIIRKDFMNKNNFESEGSNKIFEMAPIIMYTLNQNGVLFIDELDSKLHPLLTKYIVNLFNNNDNKAQLIFNSHDTNLLSVDTFRRDQIWFTEKDATDATDLYSLVEFKKPNGTHIRKDNNFAQGYIRGRYGAIPFLTTNNYE